MFGCVGLGVRVAYYNVYFVIMYVLFMTSKIGDDNYPMDNVYSQFQNVYMLTQVFLQILNRW